MRPLLAALCLVAVVGLSACDDDAPSGSTTEPTPTSSAPPTPEETEPTEPAQDACTVLGVGEVGKVLGTTVVRAVGEGGCRFASPSDPEAASLGLSQGDLRELGGLDGARSGIRAVVRGKVEELPDVGDGAFVLAGSAMGGDTLAGGGAIALGTSLIQITVIPGPDAAADDVRRTTADLLRLIAERAAP